MIHTKLVGEGLADSGKNAKVKASKEALRLLEGFTVADFRKDYGCSCKQDDEKAAEDLAVAGTVI
jgi:endoribonuclease Dicer